MWYIWLAFCRLASAVPVDANSVTIPDSPNRVVNITGQRTQLGPNELDGATLGSSNISQPADLTGQYIIPIPNTDTSVLIDTFSPLPVPNFHTLIKQCYAQVYAKPDRDLSFGTYFTCDEPSKDSKHISLKLLSHVPSEATWDRVLEALDGLYAFGVKGRAAATLDLGVLYRKKRVASGSIGVYGSDGEPLLEVLRHGETGDGVVVGSTEVS